jgi:polyhydroxyalkanoate synthase
VEAADTLPPPADVPPEQVGVTLGRIQEALRNQEISAQQILEVVAASEHTDEVLRQALKKEQISEQATDGVLGPNPFVGIRLRDVGATVGLIVKQSLRQPRIALRHLGRFARQELQVLKGDAELQPERGDQRFTDPTWNDNPLYRRFMQSYLAVRRELDEWVEATGLNHRDAERVRFALSLLTEALAPSNWIINPAALKRLLETGGASAVRGVRHLLDDLRTNGGMPSMADRGAYRVGEDLANTPGAVVFRNAVCELIQYTPRSTRVYRRPFLFIPPQINKFYLYDLSPKKSMIRYALDQGLQVFAISWRNPTPQQRDWGLDTYIQALDEAIDVLRDITLSADCNVLGGCAGGITVSTLIGHLVARGERKVNALTLMVTLFDMSAETQLGLFANPRTIAAAKRHSAKHGVLEGSEMAQVFAWLRPNDLVWNYWVNNYLLGNPPPVFDVLFWNADTTRLPARFHSDLLTLIETNQLVEGRLELLGTPIDLGRIDCDHFVMAGRTDHITPWPACYESMRFLGGEGEFVLSNGGHIQSMLAAPDNPKNHYFVASERPSDPQDWLAGATRHEGSWWGRWRPWIRRRSGSLKKAPSELGNARYPALQPAPGTYVYE